MNLSSSPIQKETLKLFKGRESLLGKIDKYLTLFDIVLLEGDYGVGKTSLGNYYRFSKENILTPKTEISTNVEWSLEEFLHVVLKNLISSIESSQSFHQILYSDVYKKLDKRYKTTIDREIQGGVVGVSLGVGNTTSRTNLITQSELINDLTELSRIIKRLNQDQSGIIIQLNNLDLLENEKEILKFFNNVRNIFQIDGINWILTGAIGLGNLLIQKLSKMGDLISVIKVGQLDKKSILETFKIRTDNKIDDTIVLGLYNRCSGKYRTINNYIKHFLLGEDFSDLFNKDINKELLKAVISGVNTQKELKQKTSFSSGKISKDLKILENLKYIISQKEGKIIKYNETPEHFLYRICHG